MPNSQAHQTEQRNPDVDLDHNFLDLQARVFAERIHMGGLRLSTRLNIYLLFSLIVLIVFAGMYVYVDHKVDRTLTDWRTSQEIAELVRRVETGIAKIDDQEKEFLLSKDAAAAEAFDQDILVVSTALDQLYQLPESTLVHARIITLRDGLVQYDEQFVDVVKAEKAFGAANEAVIRTRILETTKTLKTRLRQAEHTPLADQVGQINQQGKEVLSSGLPQGADDIRKRFEMLQANLEAAEITSNVKVEISELLKAYETDMLLLIKRRLALARETERFNDLLAYVAPSLEQLVGFSAEKTRSATQALGKTQSFARYTIGGGSLAILLWMIFVGLLLMRSMAGGIRSIAATAQRIAAGERNIVVPGRGNVDAVGQVARALEKWSGDVSMMDQYRKELEQSRQKLESVIEQSNLQAEFAVEDAKADFIAEIVAETEQIAPYAPMPELPPERGSVSVPPLSSNVGLGSISTVSQQVAHSSEYVTAAAADVERTEQLIFSLHDATKQIESLGSLITSVRDQINLLAFHSSSRDPRGNDPENLIPFNEEDRQHSANAVADQGGPMAQRFDAIREAAERAERTVQAVRLSMQGATSTANEIATTASNQALEATSKLLSQSEYLQAMLDDIIAKIAPSSSEPRKPSSQRASPDEALANPYEYRPNRKS